MFRTLVSALALLTISSPAFAEGASPAPHAMMHSGSMMSGHMKGHAMKSGHMKGSMKGDHMKPGSMKGDHMSGSMMHASPSAH